MDEKLIKLFTRILYDIERGYGALETKEFIKTIMNANIKEDRKIEIVKTSIQIAIACKKSRDTELALMLADSAFKNEDPTLKEKIKKFIKVLIEHKDISDSRLRGVYLEAIK